MSSTDIAELIHEMTAYDNSHEPKPAFNEPATVYGMVISFMVISYVCVALRIYSRIRLRCLGWDDFFVVIFRMTATIGSIFLCLSLEDGFGEHLLKVGFEKFTRFQIKFYVCLVTYTISTALTKLCILTQCLRIFEPGSRARLICWIGLAVSALWGLAFSFCALFPCFPVSGFWRWEAPARCYGFGSKVSWQLAGTFTAHAGSNVVLDAMVLALVVPLYFRKDLVGKQRLGIGLLLLLGFIVLLISIWDLQTIIEHQAGTKPVLDPTWYGPKAIILAALEVDLASICVSIPTFWPHLTQSLLGNIFVTREVHITHQHRRLSGDSYSYASSTTSPGHYELQRRPTLSRRHSRVDSGAIVVRVSSDGLKPTTTNVMTHDKHYQDDFVLNSVVPPNMHDK
ncbi:hypothetical protein F4804DRAFT_354141 [Jackrogersella minutella]|nr:hypothetical protein F4804DRAFT_354141 [Jackrogersella minutella]